MSTDDIAGRPSVETTAAAACLPALLSASLFFLACGRSHATPDAGHVADDAGAVPSADAALPFPITQPDGGGVERYFCEPASDPLRGLGLWADGDRIFLLTEYGPEGDTDLGSVRVWHRDGSSWQEWYRSDGAEALGMRLSGFPGGDPVVYGGSCPFRRLMRGTSECETANWITPGRVRHMSIVDDSFAWILSDDGISYFSVLMGEESWRVRWSGDVALIEGERSTTNRREQS